MRRVETSAGDVVRSAVLDVGVRPLVLDRVVSRTIALMCVLIVYDGWSTLRYVDVIGIIAGPLLAMSIAHVFSGGLARHVELGRRISWHEWGELSRFEVRFLLLAVPPLVVLALLQPTGVSLFNAIRIVVALEALSLGLWTGLAARRAGYRGWWLASAVAAGLVVGGVVLAIDVVLQPGKAVEGGVAAPALPGLVA